MSGPGHVLRALHDLGGTVRDVVKRTGDPDWHQLVGTTLRTLPGAATGALPWLIKAREGHKATLATLIRKHARDDPNGLAVEMGDERLSWQQADERVSRIAHVLDELGIGRGDRVALIGKNSPTYLLVLLAGATRGAVTALINWHLEGVPLDHAVTSSGARVALVEAGFFDTVKSRAALTDALDTIVVYGQEPPEEGSLERRMEQSSDRPADHADVDATEDFVYIYTSGTTGLPKPCRVSHARALVAGSGFGSVMFRFKPGDKLYSVLPLYHSSALLLGFSSCVMTRTPIALRDSFSASAFWSDAQRYQATATLYIGELARYLLNTEPTEAEKHNPIRVAVGNGMRADVWEPFAKRFGIPQIREFYGATEAPGAIMNVSGKVGSVGHVPLRRLSAFKLARYDVERDELVRDEHGRCIECDTDEVGQLLIRLQDEPRSALGDFRGYTDAQATQKKILTDVFEPGDRYFLSGDLLRFDRNDFFYFVDRIGDTYRWKGENVSTAEVAEVLGMAPGVLEATVTGVHVPGHEGQAGLCAVVCDGDLDLEDFWDTAQELPAYAQPRFVRVLPKLDTTGTFKIQKTALRKQGIDPGEIADPLYLRQDQGYVPLTEARWADILAHRARL